MIGEDPLHRQDDREDLGGVGFHSQRMKEGFRMRMTENRTNNIMPASKASRMVERQQVLHR